MLIIVVLGNALHELTMKTIANDSDKKYLPAKIVKNVSVWGTQIVFWAMVTLTAVGFFNLARNTAANGSRFLPQETMNAYQWIKNNVSTNAEVATLDWEDITLLPVFSHVNLVIGHSLIGGRSPLDELTRFVSTWKYLGYDRVQLAKLLDIGPAACLRMREPSAFADPPRLPVNNQFNAAQFMEGVLYWPYIKTVNNIQIAEDKTITPAFKNYVLELYDIANPDEFLQKYKVEYITMNAEQLSSFGQPRGMRLLYKTATRSLYVRI